MSLKSKRKWTHFKSDNVGVLGGGITEKEDRRSGAGPGRRTARRGRGEIIRGRFLP